MAGAREHMRNQRLKARQETARIRAEQAKRNKAATKQREAEAAEAGELTEKIGGVLSEYRQAKRQRELQAQSEQADRNAKAMEGAPENKAMPGPAENKADLEAMKKDELEALAEERGVEVKGTGSGGNVLKGDLVKALGG